MGPPSRLRRDLALIRADGIAFSVMVGLGESYLAPFALAMGTSEVLTGLLASLPVVAGGVLQLVAPSAMHRARSYRAWILLWASLQAASFLPLVLAALLGWAPPLLLFGCAALYWGAGLATAPAWNAWVAQIVPARIRGSYFGGRQAAAQLGVLVGLLGGGMLLHHGGDAPVAFAALFGMAFLFRAASVSFLARQSVPPGRARPQAMRARDLLRRAWSSPSRGLIGTILMVHIGVNLASPFFTPFLLVQIGVSYMEFMALLAANFLGKVVGYPLLGRIARRAGVRQLMALGGIGIAPLPLLWWWAPSMTALFVVQGAAGVFWAAFELAVMLSFLDVTDDTERTSLLTTFHFLNSAAVAVASLIGGLVLVVLGADLEAYLWIFVASAVVRAVGLAILLGRARRGMAVEVPALRILAIRPWGEAVIRPVAATVGLARRLARRDGPRAG